MRATSRLTVLAWVAALLLVAWRSHGVVAWVGAGSCASLCGVMAQLEAIRRGLPASDAAALVNLDPTCPQAGYATYQPALLYLMAPWVTATGAQACAVWPWVSEVCWLVACLAAAWTFRASGVRYALALALVLRLMGDPLAATLQSGNQTAVEAAVLWLALAAATRGWWGSHTLLAFGFGLAKPVYWTWLALVTAAGRLRWAAAALAACVGWVAVGIGLGGADAQQIWEHARSHDERGVIHPAFRAWVFDALHVERQSQYSLLDAAWAVPALGVVLAVMAWIARRRRVDADAVGLFALAQLAVTPYLKDYGVLIALPVVAWALVRVRWWMGLLLYAGVAWTTLGGDYHALASLWLCLVAVAVQLRADGRAQAGAEAAGRA
jgi:hypothetical protein